MVNIAVFASGSGTNAENLIRYFQKSSLGKVVLIVTNNPEAGVIARAKQEGVSCYVSQFRSNDDIRALSEKLEKNNIQMIVLAGFLKLISQTLIDRYPNAIINIHPALLPKYGGKGMYGMRVHEAVIEAKENQSGITIHYVNAHYDEGAIIAQYTCPVFPQDIPSTLAKRIHELEYRHFPAEVEKLLEKAT